MEGKSLYNYDFTNNISYNLNEDIQIQLLDDNTCNINNIMFTTTSILSESDKSLCKIAENKTGLHGWKHVKHLPKESSSWFSGYDFDKNNDDYLKGKTRTMVMHLQHMGLLVY